MTLRKCNYCMELKPKAELHNGLCTECRRKFTKKIELREKKDSQLDADLPARDFLEQFLNELEIAGNDREKKLDVFQKYTEILSKTPYIQC